tara:strand:+ start:5660 stop:5911 length:252 start_codon:yes stop_codon:yes gene_type:complete
MTREDVSEINPEALMVDGFDKAIIGMAERINLGPVVAYDVDKIINIMMERDGMDYTEAYEFYSYNIVGGWLGEYTPVFINTEI